MSIVLQDFCRLWEVSRFYMWGIIFLCAFLSSKILVSLWQGPHWKNIKEKKLAEKLQL